MEFVSRSHRVGFDYGRRRVDRFVPRGHGDDGDDFFGADIDDERVVRFERVAREGKVGICWDAFSIAEVVLLFLRGVYLIRKDWKTFLLDRVGREGTFFHGRDDQVCKSNYLGYRASLVHQLRAIHGWFCCVCSVAEERFVQVPIRAVRVDAHHNCHHFFAVVHNDLKHI